MYELEVITAIFVPIEQVTGHLRLLKEALQRGLVLHVSWIRDAILCHGLTRYGLQVC